MELAAIPRTFWHALSVAVVVVTGGLVAIAWRSSNVTLEIANTKIQLSHAASDAAALNEELEEQRADLERRAEALRTEVAALEKERTEILAIAATQPALARAVEPLRTARPAELRVRPEAIRELKEVTEKNAARLDRIQQQVQLPAAK